MSVLVDQWASRLNGTFHDAAHDDSIQSKSNPAGSNAGHFHQVIDQMSQLSQLSFNDGEGFLVERFLILPQTEKMHCVGDGGEWVAEFMTEHRQELVLAAVQVGQRFRLFLQIPFQAATFADVTDVALCDVPAIHLIDVADELDFGLRLPPDVSGRLRLLVPDECRTRCSRPDDPIGAEQVLPRLRP